jgi:hypothetical protein
MQVIRIINLNHQNSKGGLIMLKGSVQSVILGLVMFGWSNFSTAQNVKEWWFYSETRILPEPMAPGRLYRLANVEGGELRYGGQSHGIDLVWGLPDAGARNIKIYRAVHNPNYGETGNVGDNIRLNEPVAIYIQGGGLLGL